MLCNMQVANDSGKITPVHGKGSSVFDSMDRSKQGKLAAASSTKLGPSPALRSKKVVFIG